MEGAVDTCESPAMGFLFDDYELDLLRGCLMHGGKEIPLRYQSFLVLLYFVEHPGALISKDELSAAIWSDTSVTDNALVQCVTEIRRELKDDPRNPRFIKTFPKVGYRFIADVRVVRDGLQPPVLKSWSFIPPSAAAAIPAPAAPVDLTPPVSTIGSRGSTWRQIPMGIVLLLIFTLCGDKKPPKQLATAALKPASGLAILAVFPLTDETGRQDLDWLREGLSDMILTDLAHTGKWDVLSREKMHSLVGDTNRPSLSFNESLEIARSIQATNFIVGSVSASGQQITIDIQILDGRDGHVVATDNTSLNDPREIVAEAALLSTDIARRLGGSSEEPSSLADVLTSNVEAYRYYSLGVEKAEQFQNAEAVELFKKSLRFDSKFAMAYARIGYAYAVQDFQPRKGLPYLEQAQRLATSLPLMNRLYIEAWSAIARLDYHAADGILQQITQQYPGETEAACQLSRLLRGQERVEEAANLLHNAIRMNPNAKDLYNALGLIMISMGRPQEAILAYKQYVALAPQNPNGHDSLGMAFELAGLYEYALAEYNQALALDPEFEPSIVHLGDTAFQMGRYLTALREYNRYIDVASSSDAKALGYGDMATVYLEMNNLPQAQTAATLELLNNRGSVWHSLEIALEMHQKERAAALERELFTNLPDSERGSPRDLRQEFFYRGFIEVKTGDPQRAISYFKLALRHLPPSSGIDLHEDCLANASLDLGMGLEAIAEYKRILKINPNYPLAYYHLGLSYQTIHDRKDAVATFQRFLQASASADQDSPPVLEAKKYLRNGIS